MTDNYEYNKSLEPQSLEDSSPFADKQWLYMPDLNNGVYQNISGNTLVQFNCQNIYNSQKFISSDMFFVIPIQMVAGIYGPTAADVAVNGFIPLDGSGANNGNNYPWWAMLSMKQGNHNLIHQAEIVVEDHTLQQLMSHINISTQFQMLSRMSQDDLQHFGQSLGYENELDNDKSLKFNNGIRAKRIGKTITGGTGFGTLTALEGNGMINNRIFSNSSTGPSNGNQSLNNKAQNFDCINLSKNKQLNRYAIISGTYDVNTGNPNSFNDIVGNTDGVLINADGLRKNLVPTVAYDSTNNLVVYTDYCVIKLKDLYNSIEQLPLMRRFNAKINLYLNTGVCSSNIQVATGASTSIVGNPFYYFDGSNTTFSNTMPYNHNYIPTFPLTVLAGSTVTANKAYDYTFFSGLFVKQAGGFSINGYAGLNDSNLSVAISVPSPSADVNAVTMPSCRLYYSQQLLHPKEALKYVEANRNKRIVYRDVLLNQDNTINPGSYSKLINSGIKNPIGVLMIPMIAKSSVNLNNPTNYGFNFSQYQSPFDTCPNNFVLSLINVNATLGGQNVLQQTMDFNYENFLEQIANVDSITSSDYGISNGLFGQKYWSNGYRTYYIALDKSNPADKAIGRSLSVSFVNNSQCPIDMLYFIFYMKEIEVDVQTGVVIPV
jgi:hypothetical protein